MKDAEQTIVVIGGGASGVFAALRAAETSKALRQPVSVQVFEASDKLLKKVKISGGGRCNVTHHEFDVRALVQNYPRGERELLSPYQNFQPQDMIQWLKDRGVETKTESDGRMFPVTDSSQTIIDCFLKEASRLGIKIIKSKPVTSIQPIGDAFVLHCKDGSEKPADAVLIATGSSPKGYQLAESLGHQLTELAPSLFTFKIRHPLLEDLAGTSFSRASLTLKMEGQKTFRQQGPLLITHWGLSGPALLKLSAWAAREMKRVNYKATLQVNWLGAASEQDVRAGLAELLSASPKSLVANSCPEGLTKRFWKQCLDVAEVANTRVCSEVSKKEKNRLVKVLYASELKVEGKSRFKEEFVECGGVNLKEVSFKTMESKLVNGLFFTGEVLDVDGITGGFNFQHAWTSAWLAGAAMVSRLNN